MSDKQIIIDGVNVAGCEYFNRFRNICHNKNLCCDCEKNQDCCYKQLARKEQENEELRQYHNKCCEDNAKKLEEWLEKYNQVSRDFHNGDFCNTEKCQQLAQLKEGNDRLRKRIVTIFDCLIKANRDVIVDTLWVDKITTLWDYIAQTLGIEGDQNQIEEQVAML